MPLQRAREPGMEAFRELDDNPFADVEKVEDLPFGHPDDEIAARIDGTDHYQQKVAAMRAHATQIPDNSWLYGIAGDFGGEFMGVEYFTARQGERGPARARTAGRTTCSRSRPRASRQTRPRSPMIDAGRGPRPPGDLRAYAQAPVVGDRRPVAAIRPTFARGHRRRWSAPWRPLGHRRARSARGVLDSGPAAGC